MVAFMLSPEKLGYRRGSNTVYREQKLSEEGFREGAAGYRSGSNAFYTEQKL
jgi:hypothetical protein